MTPSPPPQLFVFRHVVLAHRWLLTLSSPEVPALVGPRAVDALVDTRLWWVWALGHLRTAVFWLVATCRAFVSSCPSQVLTVASLVRRSVLGAHESVARRVPVAVWLLGRVWVGVSAALGAPAAVLLRLLRPPAPPSPAVSPLVLLAPWRFLVSLRRDLELFWWGEEPGAREVVRRWYVRRAAGSVGSWRSVGLHARSFREPAVFVRALSRYYCVAVVVSLAALLAVFLCVRLTQEYLKLYPGWSLWEDLRPNLEELGWLSARARLQDSDPAILVGLPCGGNRLALVSGLRSDRLRRRARWVRALEASLGGRRGVVASLFRGRWTPDLPSKADSLDVSYLLESIENGAKLLGGGVIRAVSHTAPGSGASPPSETRHVYLTLDVGGECLVVLPALLAKLRLYSLYRKRDAQLLGTLRSRAVEWCKRESLPALEADIVVAGTTALAFVASTHERAAASCVERVLQQSVLPSSLL